MCLLFRTRIVTMPPPSFPVICLPGYFRGIQRPVKCQDLDETSSPWQLIDARPNEYCCRALQIVLRNPCLTTTRIIKLDNSTPHSFLKAKLIQTKYCHIYIYLFFFRKRNFERKVNDLLELRELILGCREQSSVEMFFG